MPFGEIAEETKKQCGRPNAQGDRIAKKGKRLPNWGEQLSQRRSRH